MSNDTLANAYQYCLRLTKAHYENFPVASILLGSKRRRATAVIYAFARRADDIVDEGNHDAATRHAQLDVLQEQLTRIANREPSADLLFVALADVIHTFQLPLSLFHDLLTAFRLDIDTKIYASYDALLNYCRYSANPIGRLVLYLHAATTPENLRLADKICTALQLINFAQDIDSDYQSRQRIYIPQDEMRACGVTQAHFSQRTVDTAMQQLMQLQLARCRGLLTEGMELVNNTRGRLRWELRAIVASGLRILTKLEQRTNLFARPTLQLGDIIRILGAIFFYTQPRRTTGIAPNP
jgi:squalene synthase HpnC